MTKQPSYRFGEYTEPWEENKLGEVSTSFSGGTPAAGNKKYYGGEIPFIRSAEINSDKTELFLTKEGLDNSSAKLVKKGDILYALYGATSGEVGISKINGAINQAILSIIPKTNYTSEFIMQWLRLQKKNITDKYLQGGQGNLSGSIVKELGIFFPSLPEQTAIGSFFQDIDQLISLQQRKLEVLKEQKKTYLKLLFPAKGQTKPALRFAGFEDDWKRKNFGDFLVEFNEKTIVENQHELLSSTNNGIEPRKGRVSGESNIGYKVLKKDMIVLSPQNLWLGNINYNADYESGIVSPSYKIFNVLDIDKKFISILIRHPYMNYEYGQASVQGASVVRRNLDIDLFNTIQILLPPLEEQTLIGSFFQELDKAIAKQEEKVNQLKESKQTLLRKMFI